MSIVFTSFALALAHAKHGQVVLPLAPAGFVLVPVSGMRPSNVVRLAVRGSASRLAA